jgi:hypothetical protein
MSRLSRRGLMTGVAYAVAAPAASASAGLPRRPEVGRAIAHFTSVLDFGAKGNGVTDDTRAIRAAIAAAPKGGTVWFPPGTYVVSETLQLRSGSTYRGSNPASSVIRQRDGANLVAVMADENYIQNRRQTCTSVQVEDLGIDGNSARNRQGHGLVLMTDRCLVRHVNVSFPPEAGIVLPDTNASGAVVSNSAVENRIEDCTVTQPGTYGIWITDTHSAGRQTDGWLLNNVVKNPLGAWAMRIERAAGWFIANNHVYHCSGGGFYLGHVAGTYFYCNEVDKFGLTESPPNSYAGIQAQFFMGRFRPSIFMGNICATPEGDFPRNLYTYYKLEGDQYGQASVVLIGNVTHNDPIGKPPTAHHAYESTAFAFDTQPGGRLDVSSAANINDSSVTTDLIPKSADVEFGSPPVHTAIIPALAAGAVGGGVVGGAALAAQSRSARQGLRNLRGRNRLGEPSFRQEPAPVSEAIETLSRWEIDPVSFRPQVDTIHLTYFVPFQKLSATHITSATGDQPAVGAHLSRAGIYEVLETGELNLIGATRNGAGRFWSVSNSVTEIALASNFAQLPLVLVAGKTYAYAEIQVGGSSAARLGKVGNPGLMALEPRGSAKYRGYQDLPSSLPSPSGENASGIQLYARLTGGNSVRPQDSQPEAAGDANP